MARILIAKIRAFKLQKRTIKVMKRSDRQIAIIALIAAIALALISWLAISLAG